MEKDNVSAPVLESDDGADARERVRMRSEPRLGAGGLAGHRGRVCGEM
jgi:hypothetical protein